MKIDPIENNELGSSVRGKLNRVLDAMTFECFLTGVTLDDTQTELFIPDESDPRLVVPVDEAWAFDILLLSVGGMGFTGCWRITGTIYNNGGTVAIGANWDSTNPSYSTGGLYDPAKLSGTGKVTTVLTGDTSNTFGAPVVDADTGNSSLRVRVTATGYPASEFHWAARVRVVKVSYTP